MDRGGIKPELWGGIECSVTRLGNSYVDQVRLTGHHDRTGDIESIASLGVRAVRYPVLWERVAPDGLSCADWSWTDERLRMLREAHIEPVVTLLHHGSGPRETGLLDPQFAQKFSRFARAVAERYPWLRYFTPVNEPLTTARFSALYGLWYPHAAADDSFLLALRHQLEGIAGAMRAIREIIPDAKLVQTEDAAKTYGTPELQEQIRYDNERRFATLDLQTGRVDTDSTFFCWAAEHGLPLDEDSLEAMRCPPDMVGLNYYVTSERFLDHRVNLYPGLTAGGNGKVGYVDVEAARACVEGNAGLRSVARDYWRRYRLPIAITEAQIKCTAEEHLRWVSELYDETCALADEGADVRAFTVWSLMGAYDWDSLLTQRCGSYERGAFDVRAPGAPKETAVARWMRATANGEAFDHPALDAPGWWRRRERLRYGPFARGGEGAKPEPASNYKRQILVVGSSALALRITKACVERALPVRTTTHSGPQAGLHGQAPWLVIDARRIERDDFDVEAMLDAAIDEFEPERPVSPAYSTA